MSAWGSAPGIRLSDNQPRKLSGVSIQRGFSIPNVPLIEINAVPAKQLAIFLLKGASAMVFLLRVNVFQYGLELTRAHRKRAKPGCQKKPR
jgi:hypothetical protein